MSQDYGEAVTAAIAQTPLCRLCGRAATNYITVWGVLVVGCPCVAEHFPGRNMVSINLGGFMEPKLTMQDLATAAHEAYQAAPQAERWPAVVRAIVDRINGHHFDVGTVEVTVGPRDTLIWIDEKTGAIALATGR